MVETLWAHTLNVRRPLECLPQLELVAQSRIVDSSYHFAGSAREPGARIIFQYTLCGAGRFQAGDSTYDLPAGTGFLVRSDNSDYRYYYPVDVTEPWVVLWCEIDGGYGQSVVDAINMRFGYVFQLLSDEGIVKRLRAFEQCDPSQLSLSATESAQIVMDLISQIVDSREGDQCRPAEASLVDRALQLIAENQSRLYSASELAAELAVSREHFSRVFYSQLGMSPYAYVLQKKVELCRLRLRGGGESVKEIAHRYGFSSSAQFCTVFRQRVGVTPGQYRLLGKA